MVAVQLPSSYDRRFRWTDFAQVGGGFPGENPHLPGAFGSGFFMMLGGLEGEICACGTLSQIAVVPRI